MRYRALIALLLLGGGLGMEAARADSAPPWVVDPARVGTRLPPAGNSLFDTLFMTTREGRVTYQLPFPFERLLARIDAQLLPAPASALPPAKRVLIPVGRSLQRLAAAPEYFRFPRVVVGVDTPPRAGAPLLKDRLYIGYQEKAAVLEVISYNEVAGRFEFQLVKDYRAGGEPRAEYANRNVCMACHQNGAPIFSRALWDETNANPQIAAQLEKAGRRFYGIDPGRGVDVPYAIDSGVRRANRFALTQRLWREACGGGEAGRRCRAALFEAALRRQLADGRAEQPDAAFETLVGRPLRAAARRWPDGLALGRSDLPNRNPLAGSPPAMAEVAARFEPLLPRPPEEWWRPEGPTALDEAVAGVAEFVVDGQWARVQAALARRAASLPRVTLRLRCAPPLQAGQALRCGDADGTTLLLDPSARSLRGLSLARALAAPAISLKPLARGRWQPAGGAQRLAGAQVLEQINVDPQPDGSAEVRLRLRDDRRALASAMDSLSTSPAGASLFAEQPLPRTGLIAALLVALGEPRPAGGLPGRPATPRVLLPEEAAAVPPPAVASAELPPALAGFEAWCATCHRSAEAFPPNFLQGPPDEIAARLRQCAPRIYVRLAMARRPPAARAKTPMPPETLLPAFGTDATEWAASAAREALEGVVAAMLAQERGHPPVLDELLAGGYEALRPCLVARP